MIFRSVILFLSVAFATGFSVNNDKKNDMIKFTSTSNAPNEEGDSRREFFTKTAGMAVAGLGVPFLPLESANAVSGANKVNAKLKGYVFIYVQYSKIQACLFRLLGLRRWECKSRSTTKAMC